MRYTRKLASDPQQLRSRRLASAGAGLIYCLLLWLGAAGGACSAQGQEEEPFHAGPLFDEFDLTLTDGHRKEAVGPFFYSEHKMSQRLWAVPPLLSYTVNPELESKEIDFLYPLMTYDQYGDHYRWQFFQILSLAGGSSQTETNRERFSLFPFYLQQRSSDTNQNYTAVFPIYGHLLNRLFRDEIRFVVWPLYCQTRKRDVVTDNYLVPIFDIRHGEGLHGWQFWPLVGTEHKDVTTRTNGFGDIRVIGGHDGFFALWPLFFNQRSGSGTMNPQWQQGSIPAYAFLRSPQRDSTTVVWPFFNYVDDRELKYREWDVPWPLIVFARGGKTTTRVWPLFSQSHNDVQEADFYLWPLYKYTRQHSKDLDRRRSRICFYLFSDLTEKRLETGAAMRRVDAWPLFSYRRNPDGNSRLQVVAPLEAFLPASRSIERDYSPLWSFWRSEKNRKAGASSQSLLWNLYRHESAPGTKKCSLLFGLFQYHSSPEGKGMRLFYIPLGKSTAAASPGAGIAPAKNEQ